jgi:hypothetical protein
LNGEVAEDEAATRPQVGLKFEDLKLAIGEKLANRKPASTHLLYAKSFSHHQAAEKGIKTQGPWLLAPLN